jgi:hypothetical protein
LRVDFDVKVKGREWSVDEDKIEVYDAYYDRCWNLFDPLFTKHERKMIIESVNERAENVAGEVMEARKESEGERIYERHKQEA